MSNTLNNGKGKCIGTASIVVKPVQAVIELGAGPDVQNPVLKAVHHINRHGSVDDFIAVAFPALHKRHNGMAAGFELELFGTEQSLGALLQNSALRSLERRSMILPIAIEETIFDVGTEGTAFVRDRTVEKTSSGWVKRAKARAIRRGKPWMDRKITPANSSSVLSLSYGSKLIHIRQQEGLLSNDTLLVSTYGFSGSAADSTAVFPVTTVQNMEYLNAV